MLVEQGEESTDSFPPHMVLNGQDINLIGSDGHQTRSEEGLWSSKTNYGPHAKSYPSIPRSIPSPSRSTEAARERPDMFPPKPNPVVRTAPSNWQHTRFFACWFCAAGEHLENIGPHVQQGMQERLLDPRIGNRRNLYGRENGSRLFRKLRRRASTR